jgi:glutamate 5-kinase
MGLKDKKTIEVVSDLDALKTEISDAKSSQGTGGMLSKIEAAEILKKENIETWVVNGINDNFMINAMKNRVAFTKVLNIQS